MEQTVKCPICAEPYKIYSHIVQDQSACPDCVERAAAKERKKDFRFNQFRKIFNETK